MNSQETNTKISSTSGSGGSVPPESGTSVAGFFWDLFKIFLIAFLITAPFRLFVAEPFVVSGSSMYPSFHDKDYLVVDRFTYSNWKVGSINLKKGEEPKRGEVLVFKYPKDTSQYFVKRVIALPGETVQVFQGGVFIYNQEHPDGYKLDESYLPENLQTQGIIGKNGKLTLGSEEYFVLGDNRPASSDSRVWGVLPKEDIVGRVFLRVLPVEDFGIIRGATY
ncbi:MAG: signal peptidase I [Candidatus Doudnabacteria bacterium]|nr:signal peptidase I [Candidatus Doudnabacteria bacterium]